MSRDHATALRPGRQSETPSQKKKEKETILYLLRVTEVRPHVRFFSDVISLEVEETTDV